MSRINLTIASAAILSLAIAGCASEATPEAANPTPSATPAVQPVVAKSPTAVQSFNNPVVAAKKDPLGISPVSLTASNLIQPTNATERVVVVSQGRPDPFAQIVGQMLPGVVNISKPVPKLPLLPTLRTVAAKGQQQKSQVIQVGINPQTPKINKGAIASAATSTPRAKPKPGLISVLPKVLPLVVVPSNLKSVLPPAPDPELARTVLVSGVVMLGNQLQAIIKLPDEPTSRYVEAGQRLANGLLIKRIEMNEGDNPVVIVEQYGIEVARMVGEAPSTKAPVANPVSGTTPSQNPANTGAS